GLSRPRARGGPLRLLAGNAAVGHQRQVRRRVDPGGRGPDRQVATLRLRRRGGKGEIVSAVSTTIDRLEPEIPALGTLHTQPAGRARTALGPSGSGSAGRAPTSSRSSRLHTASASSGGAPRG